MTCRPKGIPTISPFQAGALAEILAEILVLDYQRDRANTVGFPPLPNRKLLPISSPALLQFAQRSTRNPEATMDRQHAPEKEAP